MRVAALDGCGGGQPMLLTCERAPTLVGLKGLGVLGRGIGSMTSLAVAEFRL